MNNKNAYNQFEFESKFKHTATFQALAQDFDNVVFDYFFEASSVGPYSITPRQYIGQRHFSAVPFYYLDYLTDTTESIFDLGCGWNIFKRYLPNVIGIGAEDVSSNINFGDIHDVVDEEFIQGHRGKFARAFSINSLHFTPLRQFKRHVENFASMLAPNGRGFVAFNIARMVELDSSFQNFSSDFIEKYIRSELTVTQLDFEVVDIDLSVFDAYVDGNVRLVINAGVTQW